MPFPHNTPPRQDPWRRRRRRVAAVFFGVAAAATVLIAVAIGATVVVAERKLAALVLGGLGERFSTEVLGHPYAVTANGLQTEEGLRRRLMRLRYHLSSSATLEPGEFREEPGLIRIHLRGFSAPHAGQPAGVVTAHLTDERVSDVRDATESAIGRVWFEPEVITSLSGPAMVRREPAAWEDFPPHLINAIIAAEDSRFFQHRGIDARAVARAAWKNLRSRRLQGGSTITQQLSKNLFLTPERTWRRKAAEAFFAVYLEVRLSKETILTLYLNHIYMGQDGAMSVAGMQAAAEFYFSKAVGEIDLPEAATLAGLIRSPYRYSPVINPENARRRRNAVLKRMQEEGMISHRRYLDATSRALAVRPAPLYDGRPRAEAYFVDEVIRRLLPLYGEDALHRYGLRIYTTMDPVLQAAAQDAVATARHQGALVAMDPRTGRVAALVGGRRFQESQFNRATQARRQPGSAFKPFVYAAALEEGWTPSSFLEDAAHPYPDAEGAWTPRNFDGIYHGTVTIREALTHSMNAATVRLLQQLGTNTVINLCRRVGIRSPLGSDLTLALGTSEMSLLELTAAYAPFANGGFSVEPHVVLAVQDAKGNILEMARVERDSVLDPGVTSVMTSLLRNVVTHGTARVLSTIGWRHPSAGKTGTTSGGRDGWFIGYDAAWLTGVWVGADDGSPVRVSGSATAVPVWAAFMRDAARDTEPGPLTDPVGVVIRDIDPTSGLLAQSGCPERVSEVYVLGTEPRERCPLHPGGIRGWFDKFFRERESRRAP